MTKDDWRPIEEAPTDGTFVLLWGPTDDGSPFADDTYANGHLPSGYAVAFFDDRDDSWIDNCLEDIWPYPTHWQPLPEPPEPA